MQLKVISEKFEEVLVPSISLLPIVRASIQVLVDDEILQVDSRHHKETIRNVPSEFILGALRNKIMAAIEQKLFKDFNKRTFH